MKEMCQKITTLRESSLDIIGTIHNINCGYRKAREIACRPLVDTTISSVFLAMTQFYLGKTVRPEACTHVFLMEDILERQNCYADETNGYADRKSSPYWEREHFTEEYAGVMIAVYSNLLQVYGRKEGSQRARQIDEVLEACFETSETVENYMSGRGSQKELDVMSSSIVEPLKDLEGEALARAYRELVDASWLKVLLTIATDGNMAEVEQIRAPIFAATLALQVSEDYANKRRDERVGKLTFMANNTSRDSFRRLREVISFFNLTDAYVEDMGFSGGLKLVAKSALLARSIFARGAARYRGDNKWRQEELFEECNRFEANVNFILYSFNPKALSPLKDY